MKNQILVELRHCTMDFPGVRALDNIDFTLEAGECHALVGENGAGKSTLSKCVIGENKMTVGQLFIGGREIDLSSYSVRQSQQEKIAVVHQEFQLMNDMTGLENIFIGHYSTKGGFIDWTDLKRRAKDLMDFLQSDVNINIPVKYLRTAEKQVIQLARALVFDAEVIIFDELTAVLQEKEIENIFRITRILKERGIGIIYISHRLDEVFEICDSYTVLCDGRHVNSGRVEEVTKKELVEMIIGRELTQVYPHINNTKEETLLEIKQLSTQGVFKDISLTLKKGEVVGIAGLVGAGKTELVNAIFGNHKVETGEIWVKGKQVRIRSPKDAISHNIGLVPDERKQLGLNMLYDVRHNVILPSLGKFRHGGIFSDHKKELEAAFEYCEKLKLNYTSLWQGVSKLSGGNQQKIVIAKWLLADSEIILLDEPTRGIDIGAKIEIYKLIDALTKQGKGVILVSPELEELIGLCSRIYVMFEGEIKEEIIGEEISQAMIINSMLGVEAV